MTTTTMDLREFVAGPARLNRALNVIEGTVLITAHSVNGTGKGGRRYSDDALRKIATMAEGLPAYRERGQYLLPIVEALVRRMAAAGVTDPIATLRAAVDAGRDASEAPLLALARQVDPEALLLGARGGTPEDRQRPRRRCAAAPRDS